MSSQFFRVIVWSIFWISLAVAQQIPSAPIPNRWPSLSTPCKSALNSTIHCASFLPDITIDNPRLQPDQLTALCTTQCVSELQAARSAIQSACTATDIVEFEDYFYPATFVVDNYILTYQLSCRKDPATNQFCDTLRINWLNDGPLSAQRQCSDCVLGSMQTELNSPLLFNAEYADGFHSLTASCGQGGYGITTPPAYTVTPTASGSAPASVSSAQPTMSCRAIHPVVEGDSCASIALEYGVSSHSVAQLNGLTPSCSLLAINQTLCIGAQCPTHLVGVTETCDDIVAGLGPGVSQAMFLAWNPNVDVLCSNLHKVADMVVCTGPPGGQAPPPSNGTAPNPTEATTAAPKPTDALESSTNNCGRWYKVQTGDTCNLISVQFAIPLTDFYFLNPFLNAECTNLWLDTSYCVQPVGTITTYPSYPITSAPAQYFTLTPDAFTTSTWMTMTPSLVPRVTPTTKPLAPGSLSDCDLYMSGREKPVVVDQNVDPVFRAYWEPSFCNLTAITVEHSLDNLLAWNPSLVNGNATGNCTLLPNYRYCVHRLDTPSNVANETDCASPAADEIHGGTPVNCDCYDSYYDTDSELYGCPDVMARHKITLSDLVFWNPWLSGASESACSDSMYSNMIAYRGIMCVGVNGTVIGRTDGPTTTSFSSMLPSSTQASSTSSAAPPAPTREGMISTCTELYTVTEGGSCAGVQSTFGISFNDFYAWNPSIGSNCESLWLGYAYCVAAPYQFQAGVPQTCTKYHTAVSGDGCWAIASAYGIDLTTFYAWNPPVGENCGGLWLGYTYCVAGGPST